MHLLSTRVVVGHHHSLATDKQTHKQRDSVESIQLTLMEKRVVRVHPCMQPTQRQSPIWVLTGLDVD